MSMKEKGLMNWSTRGTKEFNRKLIISLSASTGFINASSDAESEDPQMEKYRKDARRRCRGKTFEMLTHISHRFCHQLLSLSASFWPITASTRLILSFNSFSNYHHYHLSLLTCMWISFCNSFSCALACPLGHWTARDSCHISGCRDCLQEVGC